MHIKDLLAYGTSLVNKLPKLSEMSTRGYSLLLVIIACATCIGVANIIKKPTVFECYNQAMRSCKTQECRRQALAFYTNAVNDPYLIDRMHNMHRKKRY